MKAHVDEAGLWLQETAHKYQDVVLGVAVFFLALVPRFIGLGIWSPSDASPYLRNACSFLDALGRCDWAATLEGSVSPAVTAKWSGALGILAHCFTDISLSDIGILVSGQPLAQSCPVSLSVLAAARVPVVLLTSSAIVLTYFIVRDALDRRTAVLAALFIAFDPFYLGLSRILDDDTFAGTFSFIAVLCLLPALSQTNRWWYLGAGLSTGLALLSKASAVVLVPLVPILATTGFVLWDQDDRKWTDLLLGIGVWFGAAAFTYVLLWPSMWVQPIETVKRVYDAENWSWTGNFFLGEFRRDPGPLFYLVLIPLRTGPLVLIGGAVTVVALFKRLRHRLRGLPRGQVTSKDMLCLTLWGLVGSYVVGFSVGGTRANERYMAAVFLALDVLGAIGIVTLLDGVSVRWRGWRPWMNRLVLCLVVVFNILTCLGHYPYYSTYFNPVFGGGPAAARLIPTVDGEGMDQVIRFLNSQPNAQDLYVGMNAYKILGCVEIGEFKGQFMTFPPRRFGEQLERHWSQFDYIVYYGSFAEYRDSQTLTKLISTTAPELNVVLNGIECARVYELRKDNLTTLPPEANRTELKYENGLELAGYQVHQVTQGSDGRQHLPVTLYWQSEEYCRDDYQVVLKLRNDAYSVWGTKDVFPACVGWENSWRNDLIMPDEHRLEVLPGTPPGSYTLEMKVLRRPGGQEMTSVPVWNDVLGTVSLSTNPDLEMRSLDMEHEINANLADEVRLLGYSIAGGAQAGDTLHLTLFWQALTDISNRYKVFVHVVDDEGSLVAQKDSEPVNGFYPTDQWQAGEIVRDQYALTVTDRAGATASGLRVGMYKPTGERLPVLLADGTTPEDKAISIP